MWVCLYFSDTKKNRVNRLSHLFAILWVYSIWCIYIYHFQTHLFSYPLLWDVAGFTCDVCMYMYSFNIYIYIYNYIILYIIIYISIIVCEPQRSFMQQSHYYFVAATSSLYVFGIGVCKWSFIHLSPKTAYSKIYLPVN